jgi:hypothetical protein
VTISSSTGRRWRTLAYGREVAKSIDRESALVPMFPAIFRLKSSPKSSSQDAQSKIAPIFVWNLHSAPISLMEQGWPGSEKLPLIERNRSSDSPTELLYQQYIAHIIQRVVKTQE